MGNLKTAALYIRVSTSKQEELSPDAQKRLLLDYAKKNNYDVLPEHIYLENGISGRKADKRPSFQKMIACAKNKEFDAILVWKFSRFARNQEESIVYKSLLDKYNVQVISMSEPIIDGPFGSLIERIIEWFDEFYSINLSTEVKRGMTEKALRGGYQSYAPLGYNYSSGGIPEINPDEASIVRYIFDSYINGMDFSTIARHLNVKGYRTKRGNPFELRTVRYILKNPYYIGKVRWNRASHSSYFENPEEEIIIADGKHEPLISEETFNAVQKRIEADFTPVKRKGVGITKHWLCGVLKCGFCGANMTYYQPPGRNGGFQCYKYTKGQHEQSCYINVFKMEKIVLDVFSNLNLDNIQYSVLPKPGLSSNIEEYKKRLALLDKKEKRIKEAYLNEIDTLSEYKENKLSLQREREQLYALIKSNSATEDTPVKKAELLENCKNVYEVLSSDVDLEKKASALRSICKEIIFDKAAGSVTIHFYIA